MWSYSVDANYGVTFSLNGKVNFSMSFDYYRNDAVGIYRSAEQLCGWPMDDLTRVKMFMAVNESCGDVLKMIEAGHI